MLFIAQFLYGRSTPSNQNVSRVRSEDPLRGEVSRCRHDAIGLASLVWEPVFYRPGEGERIDRRVRDIAAEHATAVPDVSPAPILARVEERRFLRNGLFPVVLRWSIGNIQWSSEQAGAFRRVIQSQRMRGALLRLDIRCAQTPHLASKKCENKGGRWEV